MINLIAEQACLSTFDASLMLAEGRSKKCDAIKQKYLRDLAADEGGLGGCKREGVGGCNGGGVHLPWKENLTKGIEDQANDSSDSEISFNFKCSPIGHFETRRYESEISKCETKMKIRDISASPYRSRRMSMRPHGTGSMYSAQEDSRRNFKETKMEANDRRKRKARYDENEGTESKRKVPRITIKMKDPNGDIEEVVTSSEEESNSQSRQLSPAAEMEAVGSLRRRRELAKEQTLGAHSLLVKSPIKTPQSPGHRYVNQPDDWETQDNVPLSEYLSPPRRLSGSTKYSQDNGTRRINFKMGGKSFLQYRPHSVNS